MPKQLLKGLVKPSKAAKSGSQSDLYHRQLGIVDELFCEKDAPRLRYSDRRGSQVLPKQSAELTFANA
jgi:hypothetical protein